MRQALVILHLCTGSSSFELPALNLKEYFPYLSDKSAEVIKNLQFELDQHTTKIKRTFASLVYDLQKYIDNNNKFGEVQTILKLLDHEKFHTILSDCSNTEEVFEKLHPHFSFFDFDIIKLLTSKLGSQSNKKKLKKYKKMFVEYSKQRVCEIPNDAFGDENKSEKVFVFKVDKHIKTLKLEEVMKLKYEICKLLKIDMSLLRIDEGCVKLSFINLGTEEIVITKEQQEALKNLSVIKIQYKNNVLDLSTSSSEEEKRFSKAQNLCMQY